MNYSFKMGWVLVQRDELLCVSLDGSLVEQVKDHLVRLSVLRASDTQPGHLSSVSSLMTSLHLYQLKDRRPEVSGCE